MQYNDDGFIDIELVGLNQQIMQTGMHGSTMVIDLSDFEPIAQIIRWVLWITYPTSCPT